MPTVPADGRPVPLMLRMPPGQDCRFLHITTHNKRRSPSPRCRDGEALLFCSKSTYRKAAYGVSYRRNASRRVNASTSASPPNTIRHTAASWLSFCSVRNESAGLHSSSTPSTSPMMLTASVKA